MRRRQRQRGQFLTAVRLRLDRFRLTGDPRLLLAPEALREAAALMNSLSGPGPGPGPDVAALHAVGLLHWTRYLVLDQEQARQDLQTALDLLRRVYRVGPGCSYPLPDPVRRAFDSGREPSAETMLILGDAPWAVRLDEARAGALAAVAPVSAEAGALLGEVTAQFRAAQAIEEAVEVMRQAKSAYDDALRLHALSGEQLTRFEQTGILEAADEAVALARRAAASATRAVTKLSLTRPQLGPEIGDLAALYAEVRTWTLADLGTALQTRAERTGDDSTVAEAVQAHRDAVETCPDAYPGRAAFISNLGNCLHTCFQFSGADGILDKSIQVLRDATAIGTADAADRALCLSNLAHGLRSRYERTGDLAVLGEAIHALRRCTAAVPGEDQSRALYLSNLCTVLSLRYERTGEAAALDEAIAAGRAAAEYIPDHYPHEGTILSPLGSVLKEQYKQTGLLDVLDEAITVHRRAVAGTPEGHPDLGKHLNSLGTALAARFGRTGDLESLDQAISAGRRAVAATPGDSPDHALYASNLGGNLTARSERSADPAALDEAIALHRGAVAALPADSADLTFYLTHLGAALRIRASRAGDIAALDEAIALHRGAVARTPADHPRLAAELSLLGISLWTGFEHSQDVAALHEAIEVQRRAVALTPASHPQQASNLATLGAMLLRQGAPAADLTAMREALSDFQAAARHPAADTTTRVLAGTAWGNTAWALGEPAGALDGFSTAVELLPRVAPRHLSWPDAEHQLGTVTGLASDAAACALEAQDPGRAVALLELGRGVLIAQILDTRTDVTRLREQDPGLADRFVALCEELDRPADATSSAVLIPAAEPAGIKDPLTALGKVAESRHKLARELDVLITRIRGLAGHDRFLLPPTLPELTAQSAEGPVVLINTSQYRCDALILATGGVQVVPLPNLSLEAAAGRAAAFSAALNTVHDPRQDASARLEAEQAIDGILAWLWDTITEPVLTAVGFTDTPGPGRRWPRIWWVSTGSISSLPLHAAGHHDEHDRPHPRTVIDRAVSSYAPTVRALAHARTRRHDSMRPPRLLIVAMPRTPGAPDLPGTQREAEFLAAQFARTRILAGSRATRDTILAELPAANWTHFACHAHSDLDNPSHSQLLVTDHAQHPLTVVDVFRLRLQDAELAYLSACNTARTGAKLADECLHITSAFQLAGYRHVIGTLWPADDAIAAEMAERVYTALAATGQVPDTRHTARALHYSIRQIRGRRPRVPSLWAAYIHAGA